MGWITSAPLCIFCYFFSVVLLVLLVYLNFKKHLCIWCQDVWCHLEKNNIDCPAEEDDIKPVIFFFLLQLNYVVKVWGYD